MPSADDSIISVGQYLGKINERLTFTSKYVYLTIKGQRGRIQVGVHLSDGLYSTCIFDEEFGARAMAKINLSVHAQLLREKVNYQHRCLGNISKERMTQVLDTHKFHNLTLNHLELVSCCDACHTGKIRRANGPKPNAPKQTRTPKRVLELKPSVTPYFAHTAVADSTSKKLTRKRSVKCYANVMVDVNTRWTWVTLLHTLKKHV